MIHRLYSILVLSVLISFTGNTQSSDQEPALDRILEVTTDVKKYDKINYQIIADQKYYKNNPDELIKEKVSSSEEQNSSSSADADADHKSSMHNQKHVNHSTSKESFNGKIYHSAEELFNNQSGHKNVDHTYDNHVESKHAEQNSHATKHKINTSDKVAESSNASSSMRTSKDKVSKEASAVNSASNSDNSKKSRPAIDAPFINLTDKTKIVQKEKYFPAPKIVEKKPVIQEQKITQLESNKDTRVVDELINSGIYDVYDDGKYIKFSKKRNK